MTDIFIDPVCGMEVTLITSVAYSTYNGITYYFCCLGDKEAFDENPELYIEANQKEEAPMPR